MPSEIGGQSELGGGTIDGAPKHMENGWRGAKNIIICTEAVSFNWTDTRTSWRTAPTNDPTKPRLSSVRILVGQRSAAAATATHSERARGPAVQSSKSADGSSRRRRHRRRRRRRRRHREEVEKRKSCRILTCAGFSHHGQLDLACRPATGQQQRRPLIYFQQTLISLGAELSSRRRRQSKQTSDNSRAWLKLIGCGRWCCSRSRCCCCCRSRVEWSGVEWSSFTNKPLGVDFPHFRASARRKVSPPTCGCCALACSWETTPQPIAAADPCARTVHLSPNFQSPKMPDVRADRQTDNRF